MESSKMKFLIEFASVFLRKNISSFYYHWAKKRQNSVTPFVQLTHDLPNDPLPFPIHMSFLSARRSNGPNKQNPNSKSHNQTRPLVLATHCPEHGHCTDKRNQEKFDKEPHKSKIKRYLNLIILALK